MVKTHKNIKEIAYTTILGGLLLLNVITPSLAQEGTIEEKVNKKLSNPTNTSDKINEEPNYLDKISDKINFDTHKDFANYFEIGGKPASEIIMDGNTFYSVEGIDYAIQRIKLEKDTPHGIAGITRYEILNGNKYVASLLGYTLEEMKILMGAADGEYAYVKTKIKLPKQNKEE